MTDIVERLRAYAHPNAHTVEIAPMLNEAADEIERITSRMTGWLREAEIVKAKQADEIERLRALNSKLVKHDGNAEAVCDSYACENQRFHDEIEALRAGMRMAIVQHEAEIRRVGMELDKAHRLLSQMLGWQRDAEIIKAKQAQEIERLRAASGALAGSTK